MIAKDNITYCLLVIGAIGVAMVLAVRNYLASAGDAPWWLMVAATALALLLWRGCVRLMRAPRTRARLRVWPAPAWIDNPMSKIICLALLPLVGLAAAWQVPDYQEWLFWSNEAAVLQWREGQQQAAEQQRSAAHRLRLEQKQTQRLQLAEARAAERRRQEAIEAAEEERVRLLDEARDMRLSAAREQRQAAEAESRRKQAAIALKAQPKLALLQHEHGAKYASSPDYLGAAADVYAAYGDEDQASRLRLAAVRQRASYETATRTLQESYSPDASPIYYQHCVALARKMGWTSKAIEELTFLAIRLPTYAAFADCWKSIVYSLDKGDNVKALAAIGKACGRDPSNQQYRRLQAMYLYKLDRLEEAQHAFQDAGDSDNALVVAFVRNDANTAFVVASRYADDPRASPLHAFVRLWYYVVSDRAGCVELAALEHAPTDIDAAFRRAFVSAQRRGQEIRLFSSDPVERSAYLKACKRYGFRPELGDLVWAAAEASQQRFDEAGVFARRAITPGRTGNLQPTAKAHNAIYAAGQPLRTSEHLAVLFVEGATRRQPVIEMDDIAYAKATSPSASELAATTTKQSAAFRPNSSTSTSEARPHSR